LTIFEIESQVYVQACLDCDPPIYVFYRAGMTGILHHSQLLLAEIGSQELHALSGFKSS
jgi:hypothetical protein